MSEMFKKARESGAEAVDPSAGPSSSGRGSKKTAFTGSAFRLGSDETQSEMVPDARAANRMPEPREFTLKVKFYKQ